MCLQMQGNAPKKGRLLLTKKTKLKTTRLTKGDSQSSGVRFIDNRKGTQQNTTASRPFFCSLLSITEKQKFQLLSPLERSFSKFPHQVQQFGLGGVNLGSPFWFLAPGIRLFCLALSQTHGGWIVGFRLVSLSKPKKSAPRKRHLPFSRKATHAKVALETNQMA